MISSIDEHWRIPESGFCSCRVNTSHRCTCGEWWCDNCLWQHTSAPGGRCPKVMRPKLNAQRNERGT